jgi:hypothetical protein
VVWFGMLRVFSFWRVSRRETYNKYDFWFRETFKFDGLSILLFNSLKNFPLYPCWICVDTRMSGTCETSTKISQINTLAECPGVNSRHSPIFMGCIELGRMSMSV